MVLIIHITSRHMTIADLGARVLICLYVCIICVLSSSTVCITMPFPLFWRQRIIFFVGHPPGTLAVAITVPLRVGTASIVAIPVSLASIVGSVAIMLSSTISTTMVIVGIPIVTFAVGLVSMAVALALAILIVKDSSILLHLKQDQLVGTCC